VEPTQTLSIARVRRGLRFGVILSGVVMALWAAALAVTPREPPEILRMIRGQTAAAADAPGGMTFDLRTCSHCPDFVILERGFGSGMEPPPIMILTAWSLPALWLARAGASGGWEIELTPVLFLAALLLESMVVGVLTAAALPPPRV
jgi:hypothetical protein